MKTPASRSPLPISSFFPPKPARCWSRCRGLLLALLFLAASPAVFADATSDVDDAIAEVQAAQNAAKQDIPTTRTSKAAEDALDAAARNTDDVAQRNADVKANKNSTDAQKQAAQMAEDAARAAENTARQNADVAKGTTRDPEMSDRYRDALRQRRAARMKLKKAMAVIRSLLRGFSRKEMEPVMRRASSALGRAESPVTVAMVERPLDGTALASLTSPRKVGVKVSGTGETIGHIADVNIRNLTDQPLICVIPPMVLESGSGKYQHYACPQGQLVALDPHGAKTVPIDGVCLVRGKPPLGKDDKSDLICRDGTPGDHPQDSHLPTKNVGKLLRTAASYYAAAEKLETQGALKEMPYKDAKTRREIVTQWGVWSDPKICTLTGEKPATKEDLAKVVYKQTEERGPVTPAMKKKLETGITDIFTSIQLTSKVAKDLEQADPFVEVDLTGDGAKPAGGINIDNPPPAGGSVVKPDGTMPNPTTGPSGRTPTPRADPEVPAETILADTIGALMNRAGVLQNAFNENPELAAKVERWLRAKERMDRLTRERARRADAMRHAERMRDEARKLRTAARNESNAQRKASLQGTANSLDQGASALETGAASTPEQRQEGRDAEKELKQAESAVPEHIKTEVDNALKEQANPPPREAQEKAEIGPDGKIIESPPKR